MKRQQLKELVSERLNLSWDTWAARHPHLAQAIDQIRLIEQSVKLIEEDEHYQSLIAELEIDKRTLNQMADVIKRIDQVVTATLAF
ncbi:hypothetical protein [Poriferisphaera sp. WC338]|uniref:hypothetical protein n=1 Tax=Poriferisphaera sp. WC338 TaxID=3425129 RepID=UPI003D81BE4C